MAKDETPKSGKKVRHAFRKNRSQPPRDKLWTQMLRDDSIDAQDTHGDERVSTKGALSRKRTVTEGGSAAENTGVVVAMRGRLADVDDGQRIWPCTVRGVLRTRMIKERHAVAVGDHVRFSPATKADASKDEDFEGVIEAVADRTSSLTRHIGGKNHTIAANVDQVIIVASVGEPALRTHLIDRYLVTAHAGAVTPIVCINKADLDTDRQADQAAQMYRALGYTALLTSIQTLIGIDDLRGVLKDQASVLAGHSGVGKSSLLNAVQPGLNLRTGEVSQTSAKGRHTTTSARLLRLDVGGYVVDTPGIRSYEIAEVPVHELEMHFVEFVERLAQCKFSDCTHMHEGKCAIKQAVQAGQIARARYDSYVRMFSEYENPYR
jgi:ribosome biogenesis GTPase